MTVQASDQQASDQLIESDADQCISDINNVCVCGWYNNYHCYDYNNIVLLFVLAYCVS